jgi:excisionase family DNA binding protein
MPLLLTVDEAAKELRVGRTKMFALLDRGEVESIKVGGSRRVPYASLVAYVKRLTAEQSTGEAA